MLTAESVLKLERDSIERFVLSCRHLYRGRVLDYGCGLQPYRLVVLDHIADGGEYVAHDRSDYPSNVSRADVGPEHPLNETWDVILCNQVIQYVPDPADWLCDLRDALADGGHLILTGPTNWREIEPADLFRYTKAGIRHLLEHVGLHVERVEQRASVEVAPGFSMPLGWGVVARA